MKKIFYFTLITVAFVSCKTYTVSPQSFKEQFVKAKADSLQKVKVNNPLTGFTTLSYSANTLRHISVYNKKGEQDILSVSPELETRITLKNGKRYIMYFDTLILKNDTLSGERSRFMGLPRKIPFDSIVKIEIQEGGKKFEYQ